MRLLKLKSPPPPRSLSTQLHSQHQRSSPCGLQRLSGLHRLWQQPAGQEQRQDQFPGEGRRMLRWFDRFHFAEYQLLLLQKPEHVDALSCPSFFDSM